jgi:hypothetical protein
MAVQSETSTVSYVGNNSAVTPYPVPFYFLDSSHVVVVVTDEDGVDTTLVEATDYTIDGEEDENGGEIVTVEAIPATSRVTIYREVPVTQLTSYQEADRFPAASHERALDKLTMLVQSLARRLSRAFMVRESDDEITPAANTPVTVLGLDGSGQPVFRNPDELASFLNLTASIYDRPMKTWLDAGERAAAVPDYIGQLGYQRDTEETYGSTGLAAGDWSLALPDALVVKESANITVNIPTDFPDLPAAFDYWNRAALPQGVRINVNIEAGHALTKGLFVRDGDFSRFRIISEDPIVLLDPAFEGVSDVGLYGDDETDSLIQGYNARMPVLGCVIDMGNDPALGNGYYGVWNCTGLILPECGVIGAGHDNLSARSSYISAYRATLDNANNSGIRCSHGGIVSAQQASCNDCCQAADTVNTGALDISRQGTVWFRSGTATGSGANAVNCRRNSLLGAEECNFNGATYVGVACYHGSTVDIWGSSIVGTKGIVADPESGFGLLIASLSHVTAFGCTITGSGADIGGVNDIRFGSITGSSTFGGGTAVLTNTDTTAGGGVANLIAGMNLENVNVPYGAGTAFYGSAAVGPLGAIGVFSETGVTNGKAFDAGATLSSSRAATSSLIHQGFYNPNGLVGSITTSGSATAFNTSSDETLKTFTGLMTFEEAKAILLADPVRKFTWNNGSGAAVGWGAQTSFAVSPDLATPGGWFKDGSPCEAGTEGAKYIPWGVDQGKRTPYLWAVVAGLIAKNESLEARVLALENP